MCDTVAINKPIKNEQSKSAPFDKTRNLALFNLKLYREGEMLIMINIKPTIDIINHSEGLIHITPYKQAVAARINPLKIQDNIFT